MIPLPKKKTKDDPAAQHEDFKRVAQEMGADRGHGDDEEVMRRLAKQKRRSAAERPGKK
jgi:hypothetical protein